MDDSKGDFFFQHEGWCPICEAETVFEAKGPYFRNTLVCPTCKTGPRQRAVAEVLTKFYPKWRKLKIHECSPAMALSAKLKRECPGYIGTHYDTSVPFGQTNPKHGFRSEDLEHQTFGDATFDIVVTQDVFEHIFRPDLAIKEIARTLKPYGAHIFTTPITRKVAGSLRRAELVNGEVKHILEPAYHGNPIDSSGSLVTVSWGYDIAPYLAFHSGLSVTIMDIDNLDHGIRADLNEVIVCHKVAIPNI
jgi:SAM-dependent methyltransferase